MEHFLSTVDPKQQARKTVSAENSATCRQKGDLLHRGESAKTQTWRKAWRGISLHSAALLSSLLSVDNNARALWLYLTDVDRWRCAACLCPFSQPLPSRSPSRWGGQWEQ